MRRLCIQLRHSDGTEYRWISQREAQDLINKGDAYVPKAKGMRGKAHKKALEVQLRAIASPSKSADSTCVLTSADMEALSGAREIPASELQWLRRKLDHFRPSPLTVVFV